MTEVMKPPIQGFLAQQQEKAVMQEILNTLLDASENLDLKTHINRPKQLTALRLIGVVASKIDYTFFAGLIKGFLKTYFRYMISYKRLSREETIRALTTMVQEQNIEGFKKLVANVKEK